MGLFGSIGRALGGVAKHAVGGLAGPIGGALLGGGLKKVGPSALIPGLTPLGPAAGGLTGMFSSPKHHQPVQQPMPQPPSVQLPTASGLIGQLAQKPQPMTPAPQPMGGTLMDQLRALGPE